MLSYSGEYGHFETLEQVMARKGPVRRTLRVEARRWSGDLLLLKFSGIESPEEAKRLADFELWVPQEQAAPLADGEVYLADLIGCAVTFGGDEKGRITGYLEGAAAILLEVEKTGGGTCVVPFQDVFVGDWDLERRTLELRVDWILA